ncbi:CvpA family protein [Mucilaginibacter antarcticus]|uniref:CvpA family protein n=1 Tax=Mucilaginibacter antarcticus TaxID=1855725 RepID=A0ABW5XS27_9SPHI
MNYIDLILFAIIAIIIWLDFKRGFIIAMLLLASWVGSMALAFWLYPPLSALLHRILPTIDLWAEPVAFISLLLLFRFMSDIISQHIIEHVPDEVHQNITNKVLGIIPGVINGLIWAALLSTIFMLMPLTKIAEKVSESSFSDNLVKRVSWLETKLAPIFSEALNKIVRKTTVGDETHGTVKLPYKVKYPKERPDIAADMLVLINQEREQRGLKKLKADPEIAVVALKHSVDMFARSYFSHYTPEGLDPFDRMRNGGIKFITAGENLALSQTLKMAHTGLMNSPGHKANILNPTFGRVGIGILDGGIYGLMITQNFRN